MNLGELKLTAKKKGCSGTSSMNKSQLLLYLESGVKYKKNQVHIGVKTENYECPDCAFHTSLKKLKKKIKKIETEIIKKNTITEKEVIINTLNGEVVGYTTSLEAILIYDVATS